MFDVRDINNLVFILYIIKYYKLRTFSFNAETFIYAYIPASTDTNCVILIV